MSTYSSRLQPALQNLLLLLVLPPKIIVHDAYIGGHFQWTKITSKASDVAENLQLYRVVWFFHPRFVMHDEAYIGGRSEDNIKCVVHDDLGRKN